MPPPDPPVPRRRPSPLHRTGYAGVDIRKAFDLASERVDVSELAKRGHKKVTVINKRRVEALIREAVSRALSVTGDEHLRAEVRRIEAEAQERFQELMARHREVLRLKTEAETALRALQANLQEGLAAPRKAGSIDLEPLVRQVAAMGSLLRSEAPAAAAQQGPILQLLQAIAAQAGGGGVPAGGAPPGAGAATAAHAGAGEMPAGAPAAGAASAPAGAGTAAGTGARAAGAGSMSPPAGPPDSPAADERIERMLFQIERLARSVEATESMMRRYASGTGGPPGAESPEAAAGGDEPAGAGKPPINVELFQAILKENLKLQANLKKQDV